MIMIKLSDFYRTISWKDQCQEIDIPEYQYSGILTPVSFLLPVQEVCQITDHIKLSQKYATFNQVKPGLIIYGEYNPPVIEEIFWITLKNKIHVYWISPLAEITENELRMRFLDGINLEKSLIERKMVMQWQRR